MARIDYDEDTATAYKVVREVPREGLVEWRHAIERHVRPSRQTTVVDIGAGTGQFAAAFSGWFGVRVVAVEPSAAMRERISRTPGIEVLEGSATNLPLPAASVDAAWLSLVLHHIPDLEAAARELRRVVRLGGPILIRQGFAGRKHDGIELVRWFPETARTVETYPSVEETCAAFAAAGFQQDALETVREIRPGSLTDLLGEVDALRAADTTIRMLTDDEFLRGKDRLVRAVRDGGHDVRSNSLDLLVLR